MVAFGNAIEDNELDAAWTETGLYGLKQAYNGSVTTRHTIEGKRMTKYPEAHMTTGQALSHLYVQ